LGFELITVDTRGLSLFG